MVRARRLRPTNRGMNNNYLKQDLQMRRILDKTASLIGGVEVAFRADAHQVGRDYTTKSLVWVPGALERLEMLRELHVPVPCDSCGNLMCQECKVHGLWPCRTRNIIEHFAPATPARKGGEVHGRS